MIIIHAMTIVIDMGSCQMKAFAEDHFSALFISAGTKLIAAHISISHHHPSHPPLNLLMPHKRWARMQCFLTSTSPSPTQKRRLLGPARLKARLLTLTPTALR